MKDLSVGLRSDKDNLRWYQTERDSAKLVKAVLAARSVSGLSGDDIWSLIRLC
jgi:hypothetical protein